MKLGSIIVECPQCTGTGVETVSSIIDDEILREEMICRRCLGETTVASMNLDDEFVTLMEEIGDNVSVIIAEQVSQRVDLTATLASIINEQASQRTDLTAALEAIWNKVKDL